MNGTVTFEDLDKIERHQRCMSSLCEAITSTSIVEKDEMLTESLNKLQQFTYEEITMAMEKRRREYLAFRVYRQHLYHLLTHLKDLTIQGWNM